MCVRVHICLHECKCAFFSLWFSSRVEQSNNTVYFAEFLLLVAGVIMTSVNHTHYSHNTDQHLSIIYTCSLDSWRTKRKLDERSIKILVRRFHIMLWSRVTWFVTVRYLPCNTICSNVRSCFSTITFHWISLPLLYVQRNTYIMSNFWADKSMCAKHWEV